MPKRILTGKIVSDSNDKTVKVRVERKVLHPLYKKRLKRSKNYLAHDENNEFKIGDIVSIIESSPFSKKKAWLVLKENSLR